MNNNEQADIGLDGVSESVGTKNENPEHGLAASVWDRLPFYFFIGLQFLLLIRVLLWFPDGNASCWWLIGAETVAMLSVCVVGACAADGFLSSMKTDSGPMPIGDERFRLLLSMVAVMAVAISYVVVGNVGEEAPIFTPIWISAVAGFGSMLGLYYALTAQFPFFLSKKRLAILFLISAVGGLVGADSCFITYSSVAPINSHYHDCYLDSNTVTLDTTDASGLSIQ